MTASFFRQGILRRAWDLLWSNKALWFFGLFASILAIGEEYDLLVRNSAILDSIPNQLNNLKSLSDAGAVSGLWQDILTSFRDFFPQTLGLLVTWVLILLAIVWIIIVAQAALIEGVRQHERGEPLSLLGGFDRGMANFWPILILNAVAKVFVYGVLYVVVIPLAILYVNNPSEGTALAITFWTFIVLVPIITIVAFVMKFASAYVILKRYPTRQAIAAGWTMFIRNWLVTVELAFIIMFINLTVTIVTTYTLFGLLNFPESSQLQYVMMFIGFGFVFSWLTVFSYGAWTNLFFRLEEGTGSSKLKRIIHYTLGIEDRHARTSATRR